MIDEDIRTWMQLTTRKEKINKHTGVIIVVLTIATI